MRFALVGLLLAAFVCAAEPAPAATITLTSDDGSVVRLVLANAQASDELSLRELLLRLDFLDSDVSSLDQSAWGLLDEADFLMLSEIPSERRLDFSSYHLLGRMGHGPESSFDETLSQLAREQDGTGGTTSEEALEAIIPVPEPASLVLLTVSLAALGVRRWRQRKA